MPGASVKPDCLQVSLGFAMSVVSSAIELDRAGVSLRWRVLAGNLVTGLLALVFAAAIAWSGLSDLRKREQAARALNAFELTMKIGSQIPLERSVWYFFTKPEAASADELAGMDKTFAVTDAAIAAAKAAASAAGLSTANLESAERNLIAIRNAGRKAITLPAAQRPADSQAAAIDGLGRVLELVTAATNEALVELTHAGSDIENVMQAVGVAQLAQAMRTVSGDRSAVLRFFIQDPKFPPARIVQVTEQTGQVALLWQQIEQAVRNVRGSPEITSALDHVRTTLIDDGERRYREIVAAAREGRPSPMSEPEWRGWTTPMLNNVLVLRDAALKVAHQSNDLAIGEARMRLAWALLALLLVAAASIGVVIAVMRQVIRPLVDLTSATLRLADRDLDVEIPGESRKDEIGALAKALQIFKDALIAKKAADEDAARAAEAKIERARRLDVITRSFEAAIGEIVETVSSAASGLETSAGTLTATADRSQQLAGVVASASEEASANVQSVASATEELSSSVNEISRQVQASARMAGEAVEQVRRTNERVAELSQAATRIGDVVELINAIAGQTNLLALNATIEAARAGESGRGFAVVAAEVKALSQQTAQATGEIIKQISGVQAATQDSVGAIKEIAGTIEKLSEASSTIAAAVEQQGAATQEISRNVQQAAHGTQQVSANIADVQRGATETGSASGEVLSSARSLASDSSRLKREVGKFLDGVRAA